MPVLSFINHYIKSKSLIRFTCIFFLFSFLKLFSEELTVNIKYLGLPVVRAQFTKSDSTLTVIAKSTGIAGIASKMDNIYEISFDENLLPYKYKKVINQRKYKENRVTYYDRKNNIAKRISFIDSGLNKIYPINSVSRDFFSALFFLREHLERNSGELWLDAGGLIWKANYTKLADEIIKTEFGKLNCSKFILNCQKISDSESDWSDMLTNNLVNEKIPLILWFSQNKYKLPVKIKFKMSPFPVIWQLKSYNE